MREKALCTICGKPTVQAYGIDGNPCHGRCWRKFKQEEIKRAEMPRPRSSRRCNNG
jgi:hypothetical protein